MIEGHGELVRRVCSNELQHEAQQEQPQPVSVIAFVRCLVSLIRSRDGSVAYRHLRLYLGRSIMIGLELLIAADIIHSVAVNPTFATVGVLGLIVLIRLGYTLSR